MSELPVPDFLLCHPHFGLGLTLLIYALAAALYGALKSPAFLHPVLTSVAGVCLVLSLTGVSYQDYFQQASPLHNGLSIFVVLLAVPLHRRLPLISAAKTSISCALVIGSITAIVTAVAVPVWMDLETDVVATLVPKSATAAVAAGISERLGGIVGLAAMTAVLTGLFGAMVGPSLLAAAGIRDERALGFAIGVGAHAIGTARAFQISETCGAFASIGMILNAILTVALAPQALKLLEASREIGLF